MIIIIIINNNNNNNNNIFIPRKTNDLRLFITSE